MAKKKGCGCCGIFVGLFVVSAVVFVILSGALLYLVRYAVTDYRSFLTDYAGPVRVVSRVFLAQISSDKPLELGEYEFDGDAYESFVEKQSALVRFIENPELVNEPFEGNFTQEELTAFLYADLAKMEITNYKLEFDEDKLHLRVSMDSAILRPHLPADMHPVLVGLFDEIEHLNIDVIARFRWQNGAMSVLGLEHLQLGKLVLPGFVTELVQDEIAKREEVIADKMNFVINEKPVRIDSLVLSAGRFDFSGIYNPN
jgi:hypothetical protein